jgi:hypothetical protein
MGGVWNHTIGPFLCARQAQSSTAKVFERFLILFEPRSAVHSDIVHCLSHMVLLTKIGSFALR